jgi:hypothetical protein
LIVAYLRQTVPAFLMLGLIGCSAPTAAPVASTQTPVAAPSVTPSTTVVAATLTSVLPANAPGLTSTPSDEVPAAAQPAIAAATTDLVGRLGVPASSIAVGGVTSATWPNGALGCPKPGFMYSQIVTPGYRIILSAGGQTYEYHSGRGNTVVSCTLG